MIDFEKIQRGERCGACIMDDTEYLRTDCSGARWSYHAGAGGLFTFCDSQKKTVIQATKNDPSLNGDHPRNGWWFDDLREMEVVE